MNSPTIPLENLLAEYLKYKFLNELGALYHIEDLDFIKFFIPFNDKHRFEDKEILPDDPDDKNPVIPFNEWIMQNLFEQTLAVTFVQSPNANPLKEAMALNNDIILYYKGESIKEIAMNLLEHPHVKYLVEQEKNIPMILEDAGHLEDFSFALSFTELWLRIEDAWNIFHGFDFRQDARKSYHNKHNVNTGMSLPKVCFFSPAESEPYFSDTSQVPATEQEEVPFVPVKSKNSVDKLGENGDALLLDLIKYVKDRSLQLLRVGLLKSQEDWKKYLLNDFGYALKNATRFSDEEMNLLADDIWKSDCYEENTEEIKPLSEWAKIFGDSDKDYPCVDLTWRAKNNREMANLYQTVKLENLKLEDLHPYYAVLNMYALAGIDWSEESGQFDFYAGIETDDWGQRYFAPDICPSTDPEQHMSLEELNEAIKVARMEYDTTEWDYTF